MIDAGPVEHFDAGRHDVSRFECGEPALDRWLQVYAGQAQRRDAARTFVVAQRSGEVIAYYTLVVAEVDHGEATVAVRAGMSAHFPIPVCVVARLAVARGWQRQGLGGHLLVSALERIVGAAEEVGVRAVLVHATSEDAAGFYRTYGFEPATADSLTLLVPLAAVRAVLLNR